MATITANTGSNNYNTNGAWVGGVQPTAADDVVIPASAVVTIPTATTVIGRSMTVQASGTLAFASTTAVLTLGDATAGAGSVALSVSATATITLTGIGTINFVSTSATTQTIESGGKTLPNLTFDGVGASWQLADNLTTNTSAVITLTKGTLDLNAKTVDCGSFQSSNSNTRTLTMTNASLTTRVVGATGFSVQTSTNMTINATGSTLALNSGNNNSWLGTFTYGTVTLTVTTGSHAVTGAFTCVNFTVNGSGSTGNVRGNFTNSFTCTGTFTVSPTTGRIGLGTTNIGSQVTITAAALSLANADFRDIIGAGAAAPFTGTSLGDCGGCSGITFDTAVTRYWVGGTGTWNAVSTTHWSASTGGSSGASVPLPQDSVIFDASSFSAGSQTVTVDNTRIGKDINFTGVTNTPTVSWSSGNTQIEVFGSLTLVAGMTISGSTTITFMSRASSTLTTAGQTMTMPLVLSGFGGTLTLQDNLLVSNTLTINNGTLDANGKNVTVTTFNSNVSSTRTITMGSGQWTLTGNAATIWSVGTGTNLTLSRSSNPVICNYSGATGTRVITQSTSVSNTETSVPSFNITAGTDTVNTGGTSNIFNLDFTGFSGTLTNATRILFGSLTLSSGMTISAGGSSTTFSNTSGTAVITSNGKTMDHPVTFDGVGGTMQLADTLTLGSTRVLTHTNGTFNTNNNSLSVGRFVSSNSNTRTITMGSGTWTLSGTGSVWDTTTFTGLTLNVNTSTISVTDTSSSSKTIIGSVTLPNITITGSGTGAVIFNGTQTMNVLTVNAPKTVTFTSTKTYTLLSNPVIRGSVGNIITINSSAAGSAATLSKSSGTISGDYLSIKDSIASGGARWFAGANSTNVSGNTGWVFTIANYTATHTTDANKRKANTVSHTADALKQMKRSHTTDALKTTAGSAREMRRSHTTDVAIIKARGTRTHTADANKKASLLRTHNTSANKRKAATKTHTTDSRIRKNGTAKITQKIEMICEPASVTGTDNTYIEIPFALLQLNASAFDGDTVSFYFDAVVVNTSTTGTSAYAELYNKTDGVSVAGSELIESNATSTSIGARRRAQVTLSGDKLYVVRIKHSTSTANAIVSAARIVVIQQGNITKTQIHQPLDVEGTSSSSSFTNRLIGAPKFLYEAAKYDGTIVITHEGVLNQTGAQTSDLYDLTSASLVSGSTIASGITTWQYRKSSAFTLTDGHIYQPTARVASGSSTFELNKIVFTITGGFTKFLAYVSIDKKGAGRNNSGSIYPSYTFYVEDVQNYDPSEFNSANVTTYYEADIDTTSSPDTAYSTLYSYNSTTHTVGQLSGMDVSKTGNAGTTQGVRSGSMNIPTTTDLAVGVSHSTNSIGARLYAAFIVVEVNQLTNVNRTVSHTTSSVLKTVQTITHSADAVRHRSFTPLHSTDALKRSIGQTKAHTTDAFKKVSGILKTHTTNSLRRKQSTAVYNTDSLKRKSPLVTHTTGSYVRKGNVKTHTGDSLKRKSVTVVHTTDALRLSRSTKSHTTSTNRRLGFSKVHTTDSSKRTGIIRSHTTDTSRYVVGPCVWVSPANFATGVLGTTPLVFIIPVAAAAMHFQLQIDTVSTFDNILQEFDSWVDQTNWQYWNGSAWVAITSGGVSPSFAGNQARFIPSLTSGTYYRRVRGRVLL